jgi:hypothetical protein
MVAAHNSTSEKRPERFNDVGVHDAANLLPFAMVDDLVCTSAVGHRIVASVLIGDDQFHIAVHGIANEFHHRFTVGPFDHLAVEIALTGNRTDFLRAAREGDVAFANAPPAVLLIRAPTRNHPARGSQEVGEFPPRDSYREELDKRNPAALHVS